MPVFHTTSEMKPMPKALTLLHFTSLEADDIHQHSVTIVQTTLNLATCYNKIRCSKVAGLYRKYANEVTEKNPFSCYCKKAVGDK